MSNLVAFEIQKERQNLEKQHQTKLFNKQFSKESMIKKEEMNKSINCYPIQDPQSIDLLTILKQLKQGNLLLIKIIEYHTLDNLKMQLTGEVKKEAKQRDIRMLKITINRTTNLQSQNEETCKS